MASVRQSDSLLRPCAPSTAFSGLAVVGKAWARVSPLQNPPRSVHDVLLLRLPNLAALSTDSARRVRHDARNSSEIKRLIEQPRKQKNPPPLSKVGVHSCLQSVSGQLWVLGGHGGDFCSAQGQTGQPLGSDAAIGFLVHHHSHKTSILGSNPESLALEANTLSAWPRETLDICQAQDVALPRELTHAI